MERCNDCAFTKGTQANGADWTRLTRELCLMSGEPFYCHAKGEPEPLCIGFIQALENQPEQPEWRRNLGSALLELQQLAQKGPKIAAAITDNFEKCLQVILEDIAP